MDNGYKSPHVDDRRDFADLLRRTGKTMVKHLTERPDLPVDCAMPPEALRRELAEMLLPAEGMAANDILEFLESKVMPWSMPTNHAL